ncbi:MAG: hypothetical protein H7318_03795 [Oligoflexus sp.]|nr:hypothetical protein [Oligoflexus sp.]
MTTETRFTELDRPLFIIKRISWPAILGGVVVALAVQLLLSLLGLAIGASTIDPLKEQNPMAGLATGTGIWFALTMIISLYAGGWVKEFFLDKRMTGEFMRDFLKDLHAGFEGAFAKLFKLIEEFFDFPMLALKQVDGVDAFHHSFFRNFTSAG